MFSSSSITVWEFISLVFIVMLNGKDRSSFVMRSMRDEMRSIAWYSFVKSVYARLKRCVFRECKIGVTSTLFRRIIPSALRKFSFDKIFFS